MATRIDRAVKYPAGRPYGVFADDLADPQIKWRLGPFADHEAAEATKLLVWGDQRDTATRVRLGIGACLIEIYDGAYKQRNIVHDWAGLQAANLIRGVWRVERPMPKTGNQTHWSHKR